MTQIRPTSQYFDFVNIYYMHRKGANFPSFMQYPWLHPSAKPSCTIGARVTSAPLDFCYYPGSPNNNTTDEHRASIVKLQGKPSFKSERSPLQRETGFTVRAPNKQTLCKENPLETNSFIKPPLTNKLCL
eukprot:6427681-Amphidinium_carterae.1